MKSPVGMEQLSLCIVRKGIEGGHGLMYTIVQNSHPRYLTYTPFPNVGSTHTVGITIQQYVIINS